jgi:hypothetical protein
MTHVALLVRSIHIPTGRSSSIHIPTGHSDSALRALEFAALYRWHQQALSAWYLHSATPIQITRGCVALQTRLLLSLLASLSMRT